VLADLIDDLLRCTLSQYTYWFAGNQERIHQSLIKMVQRGELEGKTSPCWVSGQLTDILVITSSHSFIATDNMSVWK
jgi:hypothetical protein